MGRRPAGRTPGPSLVDQPILLGTTVLKRSIAMTLLVFLWGSLARADETLKIAASAVPHAEILEFVKPTLKAQGVTLEIRVFTDYVQPNLQVAERQLDANFFQHKPYLDAFNAAHGTNLVAVTASQVHIEPFGAYSKKVQNIAALPDGAQIAVPNDPSNCGRALALLQKQGLIRLKDPGNILATARDIVGNPKKLKIRELEAATLPRTLDDVDLALINTNYALAAGLNPLKDALFIESGDSPYANLIVTRGDNAQSAAVKKLVAALRSPQTKHFIETHYRGAIIPAF
jgi:D-methionine transport system substrate-binding protein